MYRAKSIDDYLDHSGDNRSSLSELRSLILQHDFKETVKWGSPIYTVESKNVVGIGGFKAYTGIWFFQGVFMSDPEKKLINAQEGTTRGMRQWRFSSIAEIQNASDIIHAYLEEAIENQKARKEIKPEKKPLVIPQELQQAIKDNERLNESFEALSLGKKRDYTEYIAEAKQEATKARRLGKIIPMILDGIGLNDKYK